MWGLGPPNKRIRVTNAMLANSRRWREGAAPVGAVFVPFPLQPNTHYDTHCISVSVQFDVCRSTQCAENRLADVYQGTQSASRYLGSLLLQPLNKI